MSWFEYLAKFFKNEVVVELAPERIRFISDQGSFELKPFLIVSAKNIVLAAGEEIATTEPAQRIDFMTNTALPEKQRFDCFSSLMRYGLQKLSAGAKSFVRPTIVFRNWNSLAPYYTNHKDMLLRLGRSMGAQAIRFE